MSVIVELQLKEEFELVREARGGSPEALGELVRRHQATIRAFLTRFLFDRSMVDDLVQEVFLGAATGIHSLQEEKCVRSWLMSIAKFKAIDFIRARARNKQEPTDDIDSILSAAQIRRLEQEQPQDAEELMNALRDCMKKLKPNCQKLITDFYFDRHSAEEIARANNRKPSTVRMALFRIRKTLGRCIKSRFESGELEDQWS